MVLKLLVVMDPIDKISYKKDTTLSLLLEAKRRGYLIYYATPEKLYSEACLPFALAGRLDLFRDEKCWFSLKGLEKLPLSTIDLILIRQDPPFNSSYIFTTYLLEMAENCGAFVVNRPRALRDSNEKFFINSFPEYIPETLVTAERELLREFLEEHGDIILKPLDAMGGASIFRLTKGDYNREVILETMTSFGKKLIMAQRRLPEIVDGDKRILLIDGKPIDYVLARYPKEGETRANLACGGTPRGREISPRDRAVGEAVGKVLKERGILFAGLDMIGDYLTEINVTSPTCARELEREFSINISALLFDAIEKRLKGEIS